MPWAANGISRAGPDEGFSENSCGIISPKLPPVPPSGRQQEPREAKPFTRPTPYFLVTFTVPQKIRLFIRAHPQITLDLFFAVTVPNCARRINVYHSSLAVSPRVGMMRQSAARNAGLRTRTTECVLNRQRLPL
jgi:hypothetical protein